MLAGIWMAIPHLAIGALPPEIEAGFRESTVFEGNGSIIVQGVGEKVFIDYVTAHWRELMDHPEWLPRRNDGIEEKIIAWPLSQACEFLPPAEYVEFLGRWLDWAEAGVLSPKEAQDGFHGWSRKYQFLEANSDDRQVRKVLKRMIAVTPSSDSREQEYLEAVLDGDYADHWEFAGGNLPDERIPPETMPWSLPVFVYKHTLKRVLGWGLIIVGGFVLLLKLKNKIRRRLRLRALGKISVT